MGASLGQTGPFACSCLPFPGPQRPIKGTLMEDDKRQPTPLLSVCASPRHTVYPPKMAQFFFLFKTDQTFLQFFPPTVWCPMEAWWVKGWSPVENYGELTRTDQLKMNLNVCYGLVLADAEWRYLDTKPPLSFHFISWVLKATKCNSVDGFRRRYPSEPQWHFQFQGCW